MTKHHTPAHYVDGFVRVEFCNVCGAEGLKLLDDCQGNVIHIFEGRDLQTTNFNKALDEQNRTVK